MAASVTAITNTTSNSGLGYNASYAAGWRAGDLIVVCVGCEGGTSGQVTCTFDPLGSTEQVEGASAGTTVTLTADTDCEYATTGQSHSLLWFARKITAIASGELISVSTAYGTAGTPARSFLFRVRPETGETIPDAGSRVGDSNNTSGTSTGTGPRPSSGGLTIGGYETDRTILAMMGIAAENSMATTPPDPDWTGSSNDTTPEAELAHNEHWFGARTFAPAASGKPTDSANLEVNANPGTAWNVAGLVLYLGDPPPAIDGHTLHVVTGLNNGNVDNMRRQGATLHIRAGLNDGYGPEGVRIAGHTAHLTTSLNGQVWGTISQEFTLTNPRTGARRVTYEQLVVRAKCESGDTGQIRATLKEGATVLAQSAWSTLTSSFQNFTHSLSGVTPSDPTALSVVVEARTPAHTGTLTPTVSQAYASVTYPLRVVTGLNGGWLTFTGEAAITGGGEIVGDGQPVRSRSATVTGSGTIVAVSSIADTNFQRLGTWVEQDALGTWRERDSLGAWREQDVLAGWTERSDLGTWSELETLGTWRG